MLKNSCKKNLILAKKGIFTIVIILLIVMILFCPFTVYADEVEEELDKNVEKQLDCFDLAALQEFFNSVSEGGFFNSSVVEVIESILDGNFTATSDSYFKFLFQSFFSKLSALLPTLLVVVVISVLSGVLTNSKSLILSDSTSNLIFFVCYGVIIITVLAGVWTLINTTKQTVINIKTLINLLMPILLTLISAIGGAVTLKVYQPAIAMLSGSMVEIVCNIVLPLTLFTVVFTVVSNLSDSVKLDKLTSFFKNAAICVLGVAFTIFTSFLTVQGVTSSTFDSVSIRAAKFATRNYVPILGGYLAEGFDLILASSVLIKNAFGVIGLLLLLTVIAVPVLEILSYSLCLQIISAVIEPVSDKRIVQFISNMSGALTVLLVSIIAVAFMFFIVVMLLICTANTI